MNTLCLLFSVLVFAQGSSQTLLQQAASEEAKGNLAGAIALYDQAISADQATVQAYLQRGLLQQKMGSYAKAEADFDRVLAKDDKNLQALLHRGMVRWDQNKYDASEKDMNLVLSLDATHPQASFFKGMEHVRKQRFDQAIAVATKSMTTHIRHEGLSAVRAMSHLKKGNTKQAFDDFLRASQLSSNYAVAFWGLGKAYAALGEAEKSAKQLKIACGLDAKACNPNPNTPATLQLLRQAQPGNYPGYCMCCRLFNSENKHDETAVNELLAKRQQEQEKTRRGLKVFNGFQFEDRYFEAKALFANQVVDDSAIAWKPVHYDHGNGLALADVDGDGHLDLYFTTQLGSNALWRNLGNGTFEDITDKAGLALKDRISVTASFADADNDGDPDLFVTTVRKGNYFFENLGAGKFRDITKKAGLAHNGHSSAPVFFDMDNDGLLDVLLTNVGVYTNEKKQPAGNYEGLIDAFSGHLKPERFERSFIYRNQGNLVFRDVSQAVGFEDVGFAGDASIVDLNNDGFQDLYILNMQGDDHFYINEKGKRFSEKTKDYFAKTPWGSMGMKFLDYNNDGLPDLYITDMHSDMSANVYPQQEKDKSQMTWSDEFLQDGSNNVFGNGFYRNTGKKMMTEVSDPIGVENYWPWGLSAGDLNADGYMDLFVASSMNYPFRYALNSLFLNDRGGRFWDAEFLLGAEPRQQSVKPWFGLDCDGEDASNPICKDRTGHQVVWGAYGTRASAIFDVDEDGDLDIVTNEFNSHPMVLISNLNEKKKVQFIQISLEGTTSNRDGLGARVKVTAKDQTYTQFQDGKSGYLSQSVMPLYFGLGDATVVDRIEIQWPSGTVQVIDSGVPANQVLKIKEKKTP